MDILYVKSIEVRIQRGLICIIKLQTLDQLKINRSFKQLLSELEEQTESRTVPLAARWSNWAMDLTEQQGHLVIQSVSDSWTGVPPVCEWVTRCSGSGSAKTMKPLYQLLLAEPTALLYQPSCCIVRLKCDGIRAETRFRLSPKRTSPFKSARVSVQSTAGSWGVCVSVVNAGCTTFPR